VPILGDRRLPSPSGGVPILGDRRLPSPGGGVPILGDRRLPSPCEGVPGPSSQGCTAVWPVPDRGASG
jgi:hypothetical protein